MANSVDTDQIPHCVASDLGLYTICKGLSVPFLRVIMVISLLQEIKLMLSRSLNLKLWPCESYQWC